MTTERTATQEVHALEALPKLPYAAFKAALLSALQNPAAHCWSYHCISSPGQTPGTPLVLVAIVAHDDTHQLQWLQTEVPAGATVESAAMDVLALHIFEREISEVFGITYAGHPWPKPVRFPHDRHAHAADMDAYPFYALTGGQTHEVGVGPIHAGVIEPGHFRFSCTGEYVEHLEIHLGYQHRGVEWLYLNKPTLLQRTVLSENIAGDTTIGHTLAFVQTQEQLAGITVPERLQMERALALEWERIAMHTADLSNLNVGIAYQLGMAVIGALRTPVINFFQQWCGSRFGKSLIRVGGTHYPMTAELGIRLQLLMDDYETRLVAAVEEMLELPSVLARLEGVGCVTAEQAHLIGAVGMAARHTGLVRDLRASHPDAVYAMLGHVPVVLEGGDVLCRVRLRYLEIRQSLAYIRTLLQHLAATQDTNLPKPIMQVSLRPDAIAVGAIEAFRGELVHTAATDSSGKLMHYKVKDPSLHNWLALGLALRGNEISDFPICNKTFNLSYCGNDL